MDSIEQAFSIQRLRDRRFATLKTVAYSAGVVVLCAAMTALGYGWGWSQSSKADCTYHHGQWNVWNQTCSTPR